MRCWLNGTLTDAPRIDPGDRGFTLGDGLFETLRLHHGRACHLDLHWARLTEGARVLRLPLPLDQATLAQAVETLATAHGLKEGSARLTVTRGPGPRGLPPPASPTPTALLTVAPPAPPLAPARLVIATTTRRNEHSPLARLKTLNTLDALLARLEASDRGADDAVLLNTQGRVAETTVATLLARLDGTWVTPPLSDGALPGITRHRLLAAGLLHPAPLSPSALAQADALVLANTLGLRPVATFEGRALVTDGLEVLSRFSS